MKKKNKNYEKGALMVEIVITAAILALIAVSFLGAAALSLRTNNQEKNRSAAANLAQEAMEAVRNYRDTTPWASGVGDMTNRPDGSIFHPVKSGTNWTLASGQETIQNFTRKIVFSNSVAEKSRIVTVTVSWEDKKVEIIFKITNWRG